MRLPNIELTVVFFFMCTVVGYLAAESIEDIERDVLAARRAMRSAEIRIRVQSEGKPRPYDLDLHTWIAEGGRVREDRVLDGVRDVVSVGTESAYRVTIFKGQLETDDRRKWPSVNVDSVHDIRRDTGPYATYDPMLIMFAPRPFLMHSPEGLEEFVGSSKRENTTISDSTWNGIPSKEISFNIAPSHGHLKYTCIPSRGFNIVSFIGEGVVSGHAFNVTTRCIELAEIVPSVWFPSIVETTVAHEGLVETRERLKISLSRINEPFDESVFTLAGSGLPPGIMVLRERDEGGRSRPTTRPAVLVWDGSKIRRWGSGDSAAVAISASPAPPLVHRSHLPVWIAAALAGLGCGSLLYYFFRSSRAASNGGDG